MSASSDFLSKFVIVPSLAKGPRNFALNEPVVFDPEHPHARNLVAWLPLNGGDKNERAFNNPEINFLLKDSTYTHTATDQGVVGDFSSGTTGLYADDTGGPLAITGDQLTISSWVYLPTEAFNVAGDYELAVSRKKQVFSLGLAPWTTSECRFLVGTSGGNTGWETAAYRSYTFTENAWVHLALVYDGAFARTYIDGIERFTHVVTGNLTTNTNRTSIGYDYANTAIPEFIGKIYDVRYYNRALDDSEVFEIYQGVQPVKPAFPIGITASTGGGESGTLTAGQLVLAGNAPSGLVSRVGSLALAGALVLQGAAPTALVSQQGTITAGQLALEGNAPTAQISITGTITAGQLVLEGGTPTADTTGSGTIVAGELALAGNAPTATQTYIGTLVGGELVLEGQAPIGVQTSIGTLVAGQLVLEGNAPTALEGDTGTIVAGELVLQGNAPTASFTQIGTLTAGQLVLDGNAPTGNIGNQLGTIVAGSLVLQGYAPNAGAAIAGQFGAVLSGLTYGITTTYSSGSTS